MSITNLLDIALESYRKYRNIAVVMGYQRWKKINPDHSNLVDILNKLLVESELQPRQLPPSNLLKDSQNKLLVLLPNWENVVEGVFADNFFLDRSLKSIQEESKEFFLKVGKIISIGEVIPENQLRGYFILKGEKGELQINFALTPEKPCLIQQYQIREVKN